MNDKIIGKLYLRCPKCKQDQELIDRQMKRAIKTGETAMFYCDACGFEKSIYIKEDLSAYIKHDKIEIYKG